MTRLDVSSPQAVSAVATAVKWLNRQVNQIKPFTVDSIQEATLLGNGNVVSKVTLVTAASAGRTFRFELELNPSVDNPTGLVRKQQLN
jgi:hypothetical protein